jgi:hypothetical protein
MAMTAIGTISVIYGRMELSTIGFKELYMII